MRHLACVIWVARQIDIAEHFRAAVATADQLRWA